MKKIFLLTLLLGVCTALYSQITIGYSFGYANYTMKDMKATLGKIQNQPPASIINAKNIDNFPNRFYNSVNIGYKINKHEFGLRGSYHSTGGKLSIADYSGEYEMNFILNGYQGGCYYRNYFYEFSSKEEKKFSFFGEVSPAITLSKIKKRGHLIIDNNIEESTNEKYSTNGISILIQTGVKFNISTHIGLQIAFGYDFVSNNTIDDIIDSPAANWSGLRINSGLIYTFK